MIDKLAVFFCICEQRDKKIARHGPSQQQDRADRQTYSWQLKTATGVGWTSSSTAPKAMLVQAKACTARSVPSSGINKKPVLKAPAIEPSELTA